MIYGMNESQWNIVEKLAVLPLKKLGARVYVFGSRARGDHKKYSDLDLLFESSTSIPFQKIALIKSDLEDSDLLIKVDLVNLQELAEGYRESVLNDRQEIMAIDK